MMMRWWLAMCIAHSLLIAEEPAQGREVVLVPQCQECKQACKKDSTLCVFGKQIVEWKPYSVNIVSFCTTAVAVVCMLYNKLRGHDVSPACANTSQTTEGAKHMQDMAVQADRGSTPIMLFTKVSRRHRRLVHSRYYRGGDLYYCENVSNRHGYLSDDEEDVDDEPS